jgi:D-alanyl-D-alanine carboxypeptidase
MQNAKCKMQNANKKSIAMKKILITIAVTCILQPGSYAQDTFNPGWAQRFQFVLDSIVAADNIMGATAAVMVPGEGIWSGISGNSLPGVPLTPDKRFGIGSNTKLFIAVTIMKLQELGLLSLDDHLYQWLPPYPNIDSNITIRQLLSHQSGIYNYTDHPDFLFAVLADTAHCWNAQEILGYVLAPNFEPGTGWRYSNTNYILAGIIIEAATGESWVQKLHEIIFDPLNMDSTFVGAYEPPNGPMAGMQWWWGTGTYYTYPVTSFFSAVGAAGAILSTPREMVQWYNALFEGQLLSDPSMQLILDFEAASLFGLGIVEYADATLHYPWYNHGGNVFSFSSQVIFDLKTHAKFCVIKNSLPMDLLDYLIDPMMEVLYFEYPKKPNDAGIDRIINPEEHTCAETVVPLVSLKNFGNAPLLNVNIHCRLDSIPPTNYTWTGWLGSGDSTVVSLPLIAPGSGCHILKVYTSGPNNAGDEYLYNDTASVHLIENSSAVSTFPLVQEFEDPLFPPEGWITAPDILTQWGPTMLSSFSGSGCAVKCNVWDDHPGARYNLDMPMINLTGINDPTLYFTYAYACGYSSSAMHYDTLKILISTDCGTTWQTLFYKGGVDLRTSMVSTIPFFPQSGQWRNVMVSLGAYTGEVIIRFQDICGYGNNLFLDDVRVDYPTGWNNEKITGTGLQITNCPNPCAVSTTFSYNLGTASEVKLQIFNTLGQLVAEPVHSWQQPGDHEFGWNAGNLPSGIYFYRIRAGNKTGSGKIVKQ